MSLFQQHQFSQKSEREKEMDKLKKEYGPEIGSGYTSDSTTQKFVKKYAEKICKQWNFSENAGQHIKKQFRIKHKQH